MGGIIHVHTIATIKCGLHGIAWGLKSCPEVYGENFSKLAIGSINHPQLNLDFVL